jgi:hypothetical protein
MPNRYGDAPIIYTRVGICADTLIEIGVPYSGGFTRDQFTEVTKLKISSVRDKLRDMELYGFIQQTGKETYVITESGRSIIEGGVKRSIALENAISRSPLWGHLIGTIGKMPDRTSFDIQVRAYSSLFDIDAESLGNLWSAYNSDISCISKNPPFATRKPASRKFMVSTPAKVDISINTLTPNQQTGGNQELQIKPIEQGKDIVIESKPSLPEEPPLEPGLVEYRGHKVTVTDDLTAKFAESLVKKMIKDLKRKGIEFDE